MTSLFVRPLVVTDRHELASLVEEHLSALEPGLSLLERGFPAGETLVAFFALDARGRLVLVVLGSGSDTAMLVQAVEAYAWCSGNGALLARLFPSAKDQAPPRVLLLAPRFSDHVRQAARHFGPLSPTLVECRPVEVNGARGICFEAVEGKLLLEGGEPRDWKPSDAGSPPGDAARRRALELVRLLERVSFREAFK